MRNILLFTSESFSAYSLSLFWAKLHLLLRGLKKGSLKEKHVQDQCNPINQLTKANSVLVSREEPKEVSTLILIPSQCIVVVVTQR